MADKFSDKVFDSPIHGPSFGIIYFARHSLDGPIKIGYSWMWAGRLRELRDGRGGWAKPILLIRGGGRLELMFHAQFEPHHIGKEWFAPHPEIIRTIKKIRAGRFDYNSLPSGWCVTRPFQTKASLSHWGPLAADRAVPLPPDFWEAEKAH